MDQATVTRWRRYGKDRLSVHGADGTRLGWRDFVTGELHLDEPLRVEECAEALARWSLLEDATTAVPPAPVASQAIASLGTDERAWRIGADGEEKVGAQLAVLVRRDPRWQLLHAVPVGERGSDIDHVVIGPGGVFTLNTKHRPGGKIRIEVRADVGERHV